MVKHGNICLALKFSTVLPTTVTVIAYAEVDNTIEFDHDCNVLIDFGV